MTTYLAGWASWHSPFDWEFALGLLRATGERSHKVEYHCMLDERAGAAAVVAAEELHIDGASMTATGYPSPEGSVWTAGLGPIVANRLDPASWMYPEPLPFSFALPIELTEVDGAGNCDGTDGVTAGHTNQKPPGYREIVLQTTADTADRILAVRQA